MPLDSILLSSDIEQMRAGVCSVSQLMLLSGCTGTLPLAWGSLSNLQHLTLHENLLSGAISDDCHDPCHACHIVAHQELPSWQLGCGGVECGS